MRVSRRREALRVTGEGGSRRWGGGVNTESQCVRDWRCRPLGRAAGRKWSEGGPAGDRRDPERGGDRPCTAERRAAVRTLRERSPRVPGSPLLAVSGRLPAGPDLL